MTATGFDNRGARVALVTGASSGIGLCAAVRLLGSGVIVYGAARRVERMAELEAAGGRAIAMDITDDASVEAAIARITSEAGGVDILVNNAGYGSYGAVEDVPIDEARRQFEVNIFGLARLTQLILPHMRETGSGRIINISSMGGKMYTPFGAWYHATKHALEGWSDCLRLEVHPFGVRVAIIEPGGITTPWGTIAAENLRATSGRGDYADAANRTADGMEKRYTSGAMSSPEVVARAIVHAALSRRPRTRYAVGYMAKPALFMRKVLSDRMFDRIIGAAM